MKTSDVIERYRYRDFQGVERKKKAKSGTQVKREKTKAAAQTDFSKLSTQVVKILEEKGISYQLYEHDPATSPSALRRACPYLRGSVCKSMFIKDKGELLFFVVAHETSVVDFDLIGANFECVDFMAFSPPQLHRDLLRVPPNLVTPFACLFDKEHRIKALVDPKFKNKSRLSFSFFSKRKTICLTFSSLRKFFKAIETEFEESELEFLQDSGAEEYWSSDEEDDNTITTNKELANVLKEMEIDAYPLELPTMLKAQFPDRVYDTIMDFLGGLKDFEASKVNTMQTKISRADRQNLFLFSSTGDRRIAMQQAVKKMSKKERRTKLTKLKDKHILNLGIDPENLSPLSLPALKERFRRWSWFVLDSHVEKQEYLVVPTLQRGVNWILKYEDLMKFVEKHVTYTARVNFPQKH